MKLTCTLAIATLATAGLAFGQTTTHHTTATHTTHSAEAGCYAGIGTLDPKIPKIAGCPKTLYALKYIDTKLGTGPLAVPLKLYTVDYTGYLMNGTKFDSSVDRHEPIVFPAGVHRVITGWDTGFEGMHVGGERRLFIPYELAYGEAGKPPGIPAKSMLVFDVKLIAIKDFPTQPPPGAGGQSGLPRPIAPGLPRPSGGTAPTTPANPSGAPATPSSVPVKPATPPTADPTKPTTVPPPTHP